MSSETYQHPKYSYKLEFPFTDRNGHKVESINCRRPTLNDQIVSEEAAKKDSQSDQTRYLYSAISGLSPEVFGQIDMYHDLPKFIEGVNSFLESGSTGPKTLEKP